MQIENMPFCCTSAILGSFGEHGEKSLVSVDEIQRLVKTKMFAARDSHGQVVDNAKRCIFAISVDPKNIRLLNAAGFRTVDSYRGIQGEVHIMTLHVENDVQ
jgi:hypothetical protein